jgi:Domain of unknown function (DU1801)
MQSKAATVAQYLAELPEDRRAALSAARDVILKNLDMKYREGMSYGMIGYCVPHSVYPSGYHCDPSKPLPFAGLASQKNHMSLHLMGLYCGCEGGEDSELVRWFHKAWAATGKKLDMGQACIRFKQLEDLPLDVIGEAIRRVPVKTYIEHYEKAILTMNKRAGKPKPTSGRSAKPSATRAATSTAKRSTSKKSSVKKKGSVETLTVVGRGS